MEEQLAAELYRLGADKSHAKEMLQGIKPFEIISRRHLDRAVSFIVKNGKPLTSQELRIGLMVSRESFECPFETPKALDFAIARIFPIIYKGAQATPSEELLLNVFAKFHGGADALWGAYNKFIEEGEVSLQKGSFAKVIWKR